MQNILKPLLIIIALLGIGAAVYIFLIAPNRNVSEGTLTRTTQNNQQVPLAGPATTESSVAVRDRVEKFKRLLDQLEKVQFSPQLFSDPNFNTLNDNTTQALLELDRINAESRLGKDNPFLGFDPEPTPAPTPTTPTRPITPRR
jgi:hypothetical protein